MSMGMSMMEAKYFEDDEQAPNPMTAGPTLKTSSAVPGPERFAAKTSGDPAAEAFAGKFAIHAGTIGQTVAGEAAAEKYAELLCSWTNEPLGLYLHVPFCRNRCLYCGFAGQSPTAETLTKYVETLGQEIRHLGSRFRPKAGPVRTVYFGGGTPTILEPSALARLTEEIGRNFDLANDVEMTLEGRVSDLTKEKAAGFLAAGFNRFSLGVQSFDSKVRKTIGRHSEGAEAEKFLSNLIAFQKAAVVIDLIYGLPGQTLDSFLADLKTADRLGVDGLDTYQLNTFAGGELDKAVRQGRIDPPAPLNAQGRYYVEGAKLAKKMGWRTLSLSHYARDGRERNIYNPWAKTRKTCLGLGAGAGGFLAGHATYRSTDVKEYFQNAETDKFAPNFVTLPSGHEKLRSLIIGQMERGGLNLADLGESRTKRRAALEFLLDNWREAGLIELDDERLEMTLAGRFWGVNLTQALVVTLTE
jgi:oxygen-independent coproporphyrinogen-3 oxidase